MTEAIWQDREIRFDCPKNQLELRKGEQLIENLGGIEDVKGNIGDIGIFTITNLRLMWYCKKSPKINLSIGYDCLLTVEVKINYSNVQGRIQILNLKGKFSNSRYEFIFQTLNNQKEKAFQMFQTAYRTYESSKLYRDVKLRGALISKKQLVLLKEEKIINQYENSYNLSSNTNNTGTIILTNIRFLLQTIGIIFRFVWFSNQTESFNISVPYIQLKSVKKRESKQGLALVVEIIGGQLLGFKHDTLDYLCQEVSKLHKHFSEHPILGCVQDCEAEYQAPEIVKVNKEEEQEFIESYYNEKSGNSQNYVLGSNDPEDKNKKNDVQVTISYSQELGLAIEELPESIMLADLWKIINVSNN